MSQLTTSTNQDTIVDDKKYVRLAMALLGMGLVGTLIHGGIIEYLKREKVLKTADQQIIYRTCPSTSNLFYLQLNNQDGTSLEVRAECNTGVNYVQETDLNGVKTIYVPGKITLQKADESLIIKEAKGGMFHYNKVLDKSKVPFITNDGKTIEVLVDTTTTQAFERGETALQQYSQLLK